LAATWVRFELARTALNLDDSLPEAHASPAYVHLMRRQHAEGVAEAERAVALLPSGLHVTRVLAEVPRFLGRPDESISPSTLEAAAELVIKNWTCGQRGGALLSPWASVDTSKPASRGRVKTGQLSAAPSTKFLPRSIVTEQGSGVAAQDDVARSVCSRVRQLFGPHVRTWA
jgi:hypothetical protein